MASPVAAPGPAPALQPAPKTVVLQPIVIQLTSDKHELPWQAGWVLPVIPFGLTIFGWFLLAKQADRRERRKDIRDLIDDVRDRLSQIEQRTAEYTHAKQTDAKVTVLAAQIKADIQAIPQLINGLIKAGLPFKRWDLLGALRQAATGGDFDTKDRKVGDSGRMMLVGVAATDLSVSLDDVYFDAFPIKLKNRSRKQVAPKP